MVSLGCVGTRTRVDVRIISGVFEFDQSNLSV